MKLVLINIWSTYDCNPGLPKPYSCLYHQKIWYWNNFTTVSLLSVSELSALLMEVVSQSVVACWYISGSYVCETQPGHMWMRPNRVREVCAWVYSCREWWLSRNLGCLQHHCFPMTHCYLQFIPHPGFFCFVVYCCGHCELLWCLYPCPSGLLHWHWGNHMIVSQWSNPEEQG